MFEFRSLYLKIPFQYSQLYTDLPSQLLEMYMISMPSSLILSRQSIWLQLGKNCEVFNYV